MTDNFSPDNMTVPDEQMGLWDSVPPEPPDLWDGPPGNEWTPPEPPEDWMPPEPPEVDETPAVSIPVNSEEPFAAPLAAQTDEPTHEPSDTWERYLGSFTPDKNPDILDSKTGLVLIFF